MIARWLSILLHPFVMIGVMAGAVAEARQTRAEGVHILASVVVFTIVPLTILMWRQVRRGRWENADASNRSERPILYVAAGVALVALLAYLLVMRPQSLMVRGVAATLGMMAVCAAATRWVKVSLHMAFATLAAITLAVLRSPVGYVLVLALPALVWSRLTLQRHTSVEVALGGIIGAATGVAIHQL